MQNFRKNYRINPSKFNFTQLSEKKINEYLNKVSHYNDTHWEKQLLKVARSNLVLKKYLITAVSNNGNFEFVLNLIASLKLNGYSKFFIICLDLKLYENMVKYGFANNAVMVPSSWLPYSPTVKESKWLSKDYNLVTQAKIHIVHKLLENGFTVLLTDVDLVWLSPNVVKYIDYVAPKHEFIYTIDKNDVNTGFYIARPTDGAKKIFEAIIERQKTDHDNDQFVANRIFKKNKDLLKNSFALDKILFANGLNYYMQHLNKNLNIKPLIFHANWLIGFRKKKSVLQQEGMWYL